MGGEQRVRLYGQERLKMASIFWQVKYPHAITIGKWGETENVKFHLGSGDLHISIA